MLKLEQENVRGLKHVVVLFCGFLQVKDALFHNRLKQVLEELLG